MDQNDVFARVLKLNTGTNISWQKKYGGWPERFEAYSIDIASDGRYIVSGTSSYFGTFGLVFKIDSNGDVLQGLQLQRNHYCDNCSACRCIR